LLAGALAVSAGVDRVHINSLLRRQTAVSPSG
jgi:hypothetical protein